MKRSPWTVRSTAPLIIATAIGACDRPSQPKPPTIDVYTPGNTFSPFTANLVVGGVVRFNIFGEEHNVIFTPGTPGAPPDVNVVRNVIVERTFPTAGDFPYTCTVHPGMNGEIIVR